MTFDPLGDVVSSQYEEWVYPEPIMDFARLDGKQLAMV